ncbi:conserved protein of unknown function (plasmid) [Streptantibioticus cattleyicolor NRRL 8057 = DSM 46488]|nr:conserved protein of unknown function [Streptantibioticus cattleyicolor NRRL 8057 = DSM 46488]
MTTSDVQKLNGLAAAAGDDVPKRLIVITGTGLTRPAADFADGAKAFAFCLHHATDALSPANSRADEALLPGRDPVRRELEPWTATDCQ